MEAFGIYSLKAGIILVLFWGIYLLFLQRETFYRFNRGFLLAGLIAAVVFPLIVFRYTVEVSAPAIPMLPIAGLETMPAGVDNITFLEMCNRLIPVVYGVVFIVLLIGRSIGLARIFKSIRRNNHQRYAGYRIIESSDFDGVFSFFRFVFIPSHLNEADKHIILKHENAHIQQKHWIDLLLTNMLRLIWWFNPVMLLYEKAVRSNHEYLADKESITDSQQINYQQALLNQWFKTSIFPITNTFSYTNHLKRILMMKKNISNPLKKLYALLVIPALVIFLSAFAEKVYVEQDPPQESKMGIRIRSVSNESIIDSKSTDKPLFLVDGKEVSTIEDIKPENIESFSILKDKTSTELYGEKGKNGVILITTKANEMSETEREQQSIQRQAQQEAQIKESLLSLSNLNNQTGGEPLILVDGKENQSLENIKPEDIETISILKEGTAAQYGEKGRNGVILITTKKVTN